MAVAGCWCTGKFRSPVQLRAAYPTFDGRHDLPFLAVLPSSRIQRGLYRVILCCIPTSLCPRVLHLFRTNLLCSPNLPFSTDVPTPLVCHSILFSHSSQHANFSASAVPWGNHDRLPVSSLI